MAIPRRGNRIVELFPLTLWPETQYAVQNLAARSTKVSGQWVLRRYEERMDDFLLDVSE